LQVKAAQVQEKSALLSSEVLGFTANAHPTLVSAISKLTKNKTYYQSDH
jgi:hypothetical protein